MATLREQLVIDLRNMMGPGRSKDFNRKAADLIAQLGGTGTVTLNGQTLAMALHHLRDERPTAPHEVVAVNRSPGDRAWMVDEDSCYYPAPRAQG